MLNSASSTSCVVRCLMVTSIFVTFTRSPNFHFKTGFSSETSKTLIFICFFPKASRLINALSSVNSSKLILELTSASDTVSNSDSLVDSICSSFELDGNICKFNPECKGSGCDFDDSQPCNDNPHSVAGTICDMGNECTSTGCISRGLDSVYPTCSGSMSPDCTSTGWVCI